MTGDSNKRVVRILIVEDNEDDAFILMKHLAAAGYEAVAHRVETAREMEAALGEPWDVVIADQHLPRFSGWEALELLKRKGIEIPFLLVSGIVPEEKGAELMKAGAYDCLVKDRLARLGPAVDRALREAEVRRERNRAAQALEDTEERYRRLVEVCPDCLITAQAERVVFVNPAALVLFGAKASKELVGRSLKTLFHEESYASLGELLASTSTASRSPFLVEHRIVRLDGEPREVEMTGAAFRDRGHDLVQLVLRDVTERRQLERQVIRVSEHEQQRLGQDLHDGVCQKLVGLKFKMAALEARLRAGGSSDVASEVHGLSRLLDLTLHEAHSLAYGLCPVAVDRHGIVAALKDLATNAEAVFGIKCRVRARGHAAWASTQWGTQLFRIAQESISNAVKHGKASHVAVGLAMNDDGAKLSISDNGNGFFGPSAAAKGLGIHIMRYRAERIGAKLHIQRRPSRGTRVVCECSARGSLAAA